MTHHGHRFDPAHADRLFDPKRIKMLPPEKVIQGLEVTSSDVVADLGAGNGYFTISLAGQTNQIVYAVDIEPQMLQLLEQRAKEKGLENIQYVESNLENIQLEDHSIDKFICAFVMHEIPDINQAIREFKRILKPNGKALVLEWEPIETEFGPPLHERIASERLADLFIQGGFKVDVQHPNEANYLLLLHV